MKQIFLSFFLFVILTIGVLNFGFAPIAEKLIDQYLSQQLNAYWRDLIRGTFHMVFVDLERLPQAQWDAQVNRLQQQFGYPIDLKPLADAGLSAAEQQRALQGELVVQGNGETFYMRADQSPYVLIMGPITDPELELAHVYLLLYSALLALLALLTLLYALPFYRKLQRIGSAAAAFGEGRFETRALVPRHSALAPLAAAFNRMADRIQELIDAQRELTNAVSHELRTPIARIRFSLEMLATAARIGDRQHYLAEIAKDADELDALVTESLTYARFDRGGPKIRWQRCPAETWLAEVAGAALHGYRDIELRCTCRLPGTDPHVFLEPRYMGRALGNLLQNAAKHARRQVAVTLEASAGECCIHVDDDGDGIPVADRERVFQAFTRLDASRSRDSGGHGLGLAIVRRVADWHGGRVHVIDAPLGGARLTLCWPGLTPQATEEETNAQS